MPDSSPEPADTRQAREAFSPEAESLLAFTFDEDGAPKCFAEFTCTRDKLALLHYAHLVVRELDRQVARDTIQFAA